MFRKILFVTLLGIGLALLSGCTSDPANIKLFTSKATTTISLEEPRTFYKTMDVNGPVLGRASSGTYEVLSAVDADNDQGIWVEIEYKGKKGYVLGFFVEDK